MIAFFWAATLSHTLLVPEPSFHVTGFVVQPCRVSCLRHQHSWKAAAPVDDNHNDNVLLQNQEESSSEYDNEENRLAMAGYVKDPSATITEVYVAEIESLRDHFSSFEEIGSEEGSNIIKFNKRSRGGLGYGTSANEDDEDNDSSSSSSTSTTPTHVANIEYNDLVGERELVLVDIRRKPAETTATKPISRAFHLAGPRKHLHFDPSKVNAAICVAGGLCPGLNNVVRELVHSLYYMYGADKVYGIRGGFHGFYKPDYEPVLLTNEMVQDIHHEGGTILKSSRGGFDMDKILAFLKQHDIQQLYIIGGDGTHRGAYAIHEACRANNLNIAVVAIPKTIDNDLDYIDKSFGFSTAVEAAQNGIRTATVEAKCNAPNGVGIIKLMGRSAGFLACFAALGSGDVDLVLVPEVDIVLEGPDGILPFLRKRLHEQQYCVVVVAEGAGEELLGVSDQVDAGGNRARPKIAEFLSQSVKDYFDRFGEETTIKYIDPSYMVRSVPANGSDSLYCMQLAQNAVHGAMAGYTGYSVGLVNRNAVYLPIPLLVASSPRSMDPFGKTWERVIAMTGQPNTARRKDTHDPKQGDSSEFPVLSEPHGH